MKEGIDFYPTQCQMSMDMALVCAKYGLPAMGFLTVLNQRIYGEHGYYCEWNEDIALLLSHNWTAREGIDVTIYVEEFVKRGIFDKEMYEKYHILTSAEIQEIYFSITTRRKKQKAIREYMLIDIDNWQKNVDNFAKNVDIFTQSKVKESKEKYSKGEKEIHISPHPQKSESSDLYSVKKYGKYKKVKLNDNQYSSLVKDFGKHKTDKYIRKVDEYCQQNGKYYNDYDLTIRKWIAEDKSKQAEPSYDLDEFDEFTINCVPKIEGRENTGSV